MITGAEKLITQAYYMNILEGCTDCLRLIHMSVLLCDIWQQINTCIYHDALQHLHIKQMKVQNFKNI